MSAGNMAEHRLVLALGRDHDGNLAAMCLTCFEEFTFKADAVDAWVALESVTAGQVMHFDDAPCTSGDF